MEIQRKRLEKEYHDNKVNGKIDFVFYDTPFLKALMADIVQFSINLLGDLKGKRLLYYGCGANWILAYKFLQKGSLVTLIDISQKSIELMNKKIRELNLKDVSAFVMDCEKTGFKDKAFDLIFGRAILHHLDLKKASKEISRILANNGKAVFIEPLGINPLINFYRKITPGRRTPYEKPFDFSDISKISQEFRKSEHYEFNLVVNAGIFFNSVLKLPLNKIINYHNLKKIDDYLLKKFKFLRKYCWNTVIFLKN